jgi:dolichyl-phosphate-mannose-protein mannosyltransferase
MLLCSGYSPAHCRYENIHQRYDPACNFMALRVTAAAFGALLPLVVYATLRAVSVSRHASVMGSMLCVFDILNVLESRLILTDSQLMLHTALALLTSLLYWQRLHAASRHHYGLSSLEEHAWIVVVGVTSGAAVSIKWTALATPALVALESVTGAFGVFPRSVVSLPSLLKIGVVAAAFYTLWFWVHFTLLPLSGSGDGFMPVEFQAKLRHSRFYRVRRAWCRGDWGRRCGWRVGGRGCCVTVAVAVWCWLT